MGTTPAQRRFETVMAAQASASAQPGQSLAGSNAYELMLAKLYDDKRRLKEIQSVARKIEVKREILPDYDNWVAGALEQGQGAQDEVLVTVMVWRMDIGDFEEALRIAEYVVKHDLVLPDQYERNVQTVIVDE
ncbi:MAG TPA: terminase, partial [Pusillimonas sp.]|nr:terminase [Pusillimonas sp.]